MSGNGVFLGGVPTKPDVDKLRETYGVPDENTGIPYAAIENLIGCKKGSFRFQTVVNAWRKSLVREHHVVLSPDRGIGLIRLTENGKAELAVSTESKGFRAIRKASVIANITVRSKLSEENRTAIDHLNHRNAALRLAMATAAKQIELPDPEKKG